MQWVRHKTEDNVNNSNTLSKEGNITRTVIWHNKKLTLNKYFNYVCLEIKYQNNIKAFIWQLKLDTHAQVKD